MQFILSKKDTGISLPTFFFFLELFLLELTDEKLGHDSASSDLVTVHNNELTQ